MTDSGSSFYRPRRAPAAELEDQRDDGEEFVLVVPARKRERRSVRFGGMLYRNFRSPKSLVSMQIARAGKNADKDPDSMVAAVRDWLLDAFGSEDGAAVFDRLFDPDDDLDLDAITTLIEKTLEVGTSDPTG